MTLTIDQVRQLLNAMCRHGRTAEVDWTNHTITVLSEEKTHPTVMLSDGPMKYRDKLFQVRDE